jgi:hypothetical protein
MSTGWFTAMLIYQQPGKKTLCFAQGTSYDDSQRALRNLHDATASTVSDIGDRMGFKAESGGFVRFPGGLVRDSTMEALV